MGLMPDQFWRLTVREFWIKYRAFSRAEGRREALMLEHALKLGHYKPADRNALERRKNALKRYPVKKWLQENGRTHGELG